MNNGKAGGCCIAKYPGCGGNGFYMSKLDKIMLKFRPIAPKPVVTGSGSGGSGADNSDGYVKCVRSKRKYVRVKKSKNDGFKIQKKSSEKTKVKVKVKETPVVTLPLLPESPDRKVEQLLTGFCSDLLLSPVKSSSTSTKIDDNNNCDKKLVASAPVWLRFDGKEEVRVCSNVTKAPPPPVSAPPAPRVPQVVSYVTVESVTDTWVDWEALGCTDEEIKMNMEKDTCPGFISDDQDRVVWMNTAYKRLVDEDDVAVVLVRKDKWPVTLTYPAFTCKVKVTFVGSQSHRKTCFPTLTLPCDVWRMKLGTCAWRLDVKAALSLGR